MCTQSTAYWMATNSSIQRISIIFLWIDLSMIEANFVKGNIYREREIALWRHIVYFKLQAKVYSWKGIIQSIHSSFGANIEGSNSDLVRFLRCLSYFASLYTFSGEIVLVYVHRKKSYCTLCPFTIFGT